MRAETREPGDPSEHRPPCAAAPRPAAAGSRARWTGPRCTGHRRSWDSTPSKSWRTPVTVPRTFRRSSVRESSSFQLSGASRENLAPMHPESGDDNRPGQHGRRLPAGRVHLSWIACQPVRRPEHRRRHSLHHTVHASGVGGEVPCHPGGGRGPLRPFPTGPIPPPSCWLPPTSISRRERCGPPTPSCTQGAERKGESITITRHGVPIARLVGIDPGTREETATIIARMRRARAGRPSISVTAS